MKVVFASLLPPVGPTSAPAFGRSSHGIAPSSTNCEFVEDCSGGEVLLPQTLLLSRESCHVGRSVPASSGLGLLKWVMIWRSSPSWTSNRVACGPTNAQAKPDAGHFSGFVIALGQGMQM